jgi:hypothetical protein
VLSLPPSVRLFVATQPIDGRKGPDSLMALVRDELRHDPLLCGAAAYVADAPPEATRCGITRGARRSSPHFLQAFSRTWSTESLGRNRWVRPVDTPARARVLRIISTSASAYRCVVASWACPSYA